MPAAALILAAVLQASQPIALAESASGSTITLYAEAGPCVGVARLAVWVSADARERIPGCWIPAGDLVWVSFLDGERADIPLQLLKKPASL